MFPAHKFSCHFSLSDALPRWQSCKWKRGWKQLGFFFFFFMLTHFTLAFFLRRSAITTEDPYVPTGVSFLLPQHCVRGAFFQSSHTHTNIAVIFSFLFYMAGLFVVMAAFVHCLYCVECTVRFTVPHSGTGVSRSQCAGRFCNFLWQVFPFLLTPSSLTISRRMLC